MPPIGGKPPRSPNPLLGGGGPTFLLSGGGIPKPPLASGGGPPPALAPGGGPRGGNPLSFPPPPRASSDPMAAPTSEIFEKICMVVRSTEITKTFIFYLFRVHDAWKYKRRLEYKRRLGV